MKVLLTGFEPFGGESMNPSWEAVRRVEDVEKGILCAQLPVTFAGAAQKVEQLLMEQQPDALILVGQAGGRRGISIERIALNLDDARIPDNEGFQPIDQPIAADGPVAYLSTLPVRTLVQAVQNAGIEASVSNTAGTYVCNHVYYHALHCIARHAWPTRTVFVHVPFSEVQAAAHPGAPSLTLEEMARALRAIVDTLK